MVSTQMVPVYLFNERRIATVHALLAAVRDGLMDQIDMDDDSQETRDLIDYVGDIQQAMHTLEAVAKTSDMSHFVDDQPSWREA